MLQWPANSALFWFVAAASSVALWLVSRIRRDPAPGTLPPPPPSGPPRLLRRRFIAAWIAAELAAAFTPTATHAIFADSSGLPWLTTRDQMLISGGAAVVAFGLVLVAVALLADRARSRRRCPRCWYDMAAIPGMTCPECGKTPRAERAFFRTRRHWKGAAWATLVIIGGVAIGLTPIVTGPNWPRFVPLPVLAILDWPAQRPVFDEIVARIGRRRTPGPALSLGERTVLARCRSILAAASSPADLESALAVAAMFGAHADDLGPSAVRLLDSANGRVQQAAVRLLGTAALGDASIGASLLRLYDHPSPRLHNVVTMTLVQRARAAPGPNLDTLIGALERPQNPGRERAWFALQETPRDPRVAAWARRSLKDPIMGGLAAATLLMSEPDNPEAMQALLAAFETDRRLTGARHLDALIWFVAEERCDDPALVKAAVGAMTRVRRGMFYADTFVWRTRSLPPECQSRFAIEAVRVPALRSMVLFNLPIDPVVRKALADELSAILPTLDAQSDEASNTRDALEILQETASARPRPVAESKR